MMMKPPQQQQAAPSGRKPVIGLSSPGSPNGAVSPALRQERPAGSSRGRGTVKSPLQTPVFEGVYNNSRMLHFLTAVVGSTCDVRVKNGNVFQGIFKTLSSKFELAVDAVHKKTGDPSVGPRREEIVDTMVFKPMDIQVVHFRNVDFNYATKDKFTDSAIAMSSKVNGEHKEKVLMRWDGGENSDDYDLESDVSNGWDPNEMFKYNEENYGVKTTYDSSLSSYTIPLEKDNTDEFRQREARAAQLAREIESSPQYRQRIAIENDDGRTEEEKHSSVQRQTSERDSPSLGCRDAKFPPLPQRVRDGPRGSIRTNSTRGARTSVGSLPPRVTAHHPETSSSTAPEQRGVNGGASRMSPKAQRPLRGAKTLSSPSSRPVEVSPTQAVGRVMYPPRSPKSSSSTTSVSSLDSPVGSSLPSDLSSPPESRTSLESGASLNPPSPKMSTPSPLPVVEGKDVSMPGTKDPIRAAEVTGASDSKTPCKGLPIDQKRNQLEELRKFGADFILQPSSAPEADVEPFVHRAKDGMEVKVQPSEVKACETTDEPEPVMIQHTSASPDVTVIPKEEKGLCEETECATQTVSPQCKNESEEKEEGLVPDPVKKSTLNPNAKEFNPSKPLLTVNKATSTPTSPGPRTHSANTHPMMTGQNITYNQFISYLPPLHMSQAVQAQQMYQYPVSNSVPGQQGKYRGTKGSLPPQRSDQHQPTSAPPIMQAAAAAGPPLVAATPYSSYIYNPQQFTGQPTLMQPMAHYPSQPVFAPMLQSNPRMLSGSHPQAMVSSSTPQYPPTDQPTPQALYATYSHHAAQLHSHQPQPSTTPTGGQQQGQHTAPSPVQHQGGQPQHMGNGPQQNLYHTATLTATPPSLTPGPTAQSPQSSYPQQAVYAIHAHQQLQHSYGNMTHMTQAHVQSGLPGGPPPHPGGPHPTQVMLLHPSQTHGGPSQGQQSGVASISASNPSPYTYLGHHPVQSHPPQQLPYHPPGN